MKKVDFEALAAGAADNVFAFADFTKRTEYIFSDASNSAAPLTRLKARKGGPA